MPGWLRALGTTTDARILLPFVTKLLKDATAVGVHPVRTPVSCSVASKVCHLPSCMYVLRAGQFQAALTKTSLYRRRMAPRLGTQIETQPEEQVTQ